MTEKTDQQETGTLNDTRARWIFSLFFFAYRTMIKEGDVYLSSLQLGRAQFRVMFILKQKQGYTMGQLRQVLGISNQAITRVLKQLLVEGYVTQELSVEDRRKRFLFLTEKGEAVIDKVTRAQRRCFDKALARVGPEEFRAFEATLLAMLSDSEKEWMEIAWEEDRFLWDDIL